MDQGDLDTAQEHSNKARATKPSSKTKNSGEGEEGEELENLHPLAVLISIYIALRRGDSQKALDFVSKISQFHDPHGILSHSVKGRPHKNKI